MPAPSPVPSPSPVRSPNPCQVLLLRLAARLARARPSSALEASWLASLARAVRDRLDRGESACASPPTATASPPPPPPPTPPLQPDGTLLADEQRLYFAADFHNSERFDHLCAALKDIVPSPAALKEAMQQQALLNVRDAPAALHLLTKPEPPSIELAARHREL